MILLVCKTILKLKVCYCMFSSEVNEVISAWVKKVFELYLIFFLDEITNTDEYAPGPYGIIARNAAIGKYFIMKLLLESFLRKKENLKRLFLF